MAEEKKEPAAPEAAKPAPKKEKPTNCAVCNKLIKNTRRYYRNGKFFCTKRCWKTTVKKEEAKGAAAQSAESNGKT